jgi:uncharacterized protein
VRVLGLVGLCAAGLAALLLLVGSTDDAGLLVGPDTPSESAAASHVPPSISPEIDALAAGLVSFHPPRSPSADEVDPVRVAVRIADTPGARARGLQEVDVLPAEVGLLFDFPEPAGAGARGGFWMLDTRIPLDIVFARSGRVVGTATMQPCPGPPCPVTHPGVDYDLAVELPAGWLARNGVTLAWSVTWERTLGAAPGSERG